MNSVAKKYYLNLHLSLLVSYTALPAIYLSFVLGNETLKCDWERLGLGERSFNKVLNKTKNLTEGHKF